MSSPISGFTAIPNPQMLAFMPIQSYLMMYFAGAGWQIGKRKVSAIPNDKFNPMTSTDLLKTFTADLRESIPELEKSLQDITPLIEILIKQYGEFITEAIRVAPQVAQTIGGALVNPKGALVPPLFGPELEKIVTGNPTQAQFLAFAKIFLQAEVDRIKNQADQAKKATQFNAPFKLPTASIFQGPEINPRTGETTSFVAARKSLPPPAPHIVERLRSNLSIQSIKLEISSLESKIRTLSSRLQQEQLRTGQAATTKRARVSAAFNQLQTAKQDLADFLKMHGSRL